MKKIIYLLMATLITAGTLNSVSAQATTKKETIDTKAALGKGADSNVSEEKTSNSPAQKDAAEPKSRGQRYGSSYSDIVIDNWTGLNIDIYVDGSFRGTIGAWEKKVTWAVPGNTKLYAKATYTDGTYTYWGPRYVETGYEYTWKLNP